MQGKKILFTDIDGTLIRSDQTISVKAAAALDEMARAGHVIVLSSGRPLGSIMNVYNYLCSVMKSTFKQAFIIANNGAQITDIISGKDLSEKRLPLALVDSVQSIAEQFDVHIQTYSDTHIICTRDDEETRSYTKRIILPVKIDPVLSRSLEKPPYKMLALSLKGSPFLYPFRDAVNDQLGDKVNTIFSGNGYLEIVDKAADKGSAVSFICRHLGISEADCFAAGDSENDISMLRVCGTGYAMANAAPAVKQSADKVTCHTHDEDGISEVISALTGAAS